MEDIILIGYGGHAKSVADCIENSNEYRIIGYTDVKEVDCKYKYLGTDDELGRLFASGISKAIVTIGDVGDASLRVQKMEQLLSIGFSLPVIIDESAIISSSATIGMGAFVGKGAIINTGCKIGNGCIINTGTIVEHECMIGDYSHISVGAVVCGEVSVGRETFVGANSAICQCLHIGNNVRIGAGAVVIGDIEDNCTAVGVPAAVVKR